MILVCRCRKSFEVIAGTPMDPPARQELENIARACGWSFREDGSAMCTECTKQFGSLRAIKESPEYQEYHRRVVRAWVELMGENVREFFDRECDYLEDFAQQTEPAQVASDQQDALDSSV